MIIQDIEWKGDVNINSELLTHLQVTDDITLIIAETTT